MNMRILVTGHRGYIGTVMVPMLLQAGHEVVGLDSDLYERSTFIDNISVIPEIKKDVRDVEICDLRGFDAIIHLAALSNDPLGDLNPRLTFQINHLASVRLATFAKQARVRRFIFSSSCSNYGAAGSSIMNEGSSLNPVSPYGISKMLVERDVRALASPEFSPVFMRNGTAYGVSPRHRFDLVLNNLVAWAFTTKRIYIKSDGTPWRPMIHVEDIARAFLFVLEAPKAAIHNETYNVGSNKENYQIRDLAEIVADTVPGAHVEFAADAGPDSRSYRVDFRKIQRDLPGFRPQWTVKLGAQQLLASYQEVGLALEDFEGTRFKRVAQLKELLGTGRIDETLRWKTPLAA